SRWRALLATLWPGIADVRTVRVRGTAAQAQLICGWLRSRLDRDDIALEHVEAERLEGIDLDGEPAPFPPGDPPKPSDVLSDELDRFSRDRIYEAAVRAVALYACFPLVRRLDRRLYRHRPEVHEEGEAWVATCACGWSARNRIRAE